MMGMWAMLREALNLTPCSTSLPSPIPSLTDLLFPFSSLTHFLPHCFPLSPITHTHTILTGDLSYGMGDVSDWDHWGKEVEPLATRVPYMVVMMSCFFCAHFFN